MPARQYAKNFLQSVSNVAEIGRVACRKGQRCLILIGLQFSTQVLTRARNGKPLVIQQLLDSQDALYVASPVHSLPGAALCRLELRELGFPEPQYIRRQVAKARYFADAKVEFLGNHDVAGLFRSGFCLYGHRSIRASGARAGSLIARSRAKNNLKTSLAVDRWLLAKPSTHRFRAAKDQPPKTTDEDQTEKPPRRCFSEEAANFRCEFVSPATSVSFSS